MSKNKIKELQKYISIYADNLNCLDHDTESSEITNMLIIRDDIEELLNIAPLSVAIKAKIKLLELDRELVEKKAYVIEAIRGLGTEIHKPTTHWWWYLELTTEEKVASEVG